MKLKNFKSKYYYSLIRLHLLKHQIYKNDTSKISFYNSLDFLELNIKRILSLIHFYNINNKRILFVGLPYIQKKRFFKHLNHVFLPKNFCVREKSLNTNKYLFEIKQKLDFQKINLTVQNFDLIIFFNPNLRHIEMLKEFRKFKIPLILIGNQKKLNNIFSKYCFSAFTIRKTTKQFFSFLIYSILKKN